MSVADMLIVFNEYRRPYIWGYECEGVAMSGGIAGGIVEQAQHIMLYDHIVASHFGDEHVFESDGVVGDYKPAVNYVAVC